MQTPTHNPGGRVLPSPRLRHAAGRLRAAFSHLRHRALRDETGSVLIEAVVSAGIVLIIAGGVFGALEATARSGQDERNRTRAQAFAEADQQRMRGMDVASLDNYDEVRVISEADTDFTVTSKARFISDGSGTSSCENGNQPIDYIKIESSVSYGAIGGRPPVEIAGLVAPPVSEISQTKGALVVSVVDQNGDPVPGVSLSGSGTQNFSGTTESQGCAFFNNLTEGPYTLASNSATLVDKDGVSGGSKSISVIAQTVTSVVFELAEPGSIQANYQTKAYGLPVFNTSTDTIRVHNTGMTQAQTKGTIGSYQSSLPVNNLFPFTSSYSVYSGICENHHPNPSGDPASPTAIGVSTVAVNSGSSSNVTVRLPGVSFTAYSGSNTGSSRAAGATVMVRDKDCPHPTTGNPVDRYFTTNSQGQLDFPGFPYGNYDFCVTNGSRKRWVTNVAIKNYTVAPTVNAFLTGSGSSSGGACP